MVVRRAVAIAMLLAFAPAARADKVDWTPYLEKPGTKYAIKSTKPVADSEPPAKAASAKPKKKTKAKAPTKARRKAR